MVKNKLEKKFSESFKAQSFFGWKLHNNMLAHQTTPADYDLAYVDSEYAYHRILVECKQVTLTKDPKRTLKISRLKQTGDMLGFINAIPRFHEAFYCIAFKERMWAKSDIYLIPVEEMAQFLQTWLKQSLNRQDMLEHFGRHKTKMIDGNIINLSLLNTYR